MRKKLEEHLKTIQDKGKMLVVPYMMAGDGGLENLEAQLLLLESTGVSSIEIGIPFSDPVADGPVIQAAGLRALNAGVTLKKIMAVLKTSQVKIPLVIMSYFNPILAYGLPDFIKDLALTPVKGLIIPDLPYEHRDYLLPLIEETDLSLIPLISLTTSNDRAETLIDAGSGFVYAVTVNGTTGARTTFESSLQEHFKALHEISSLPVLAGFGVSEVAHVEEFSKSCDGVIIGSKVVRLLAENKMAELVDFLGLVVQVNKK